MIKLKTFLVIFLGILGVSVGAVFLAIENEGAPLLTKFIFKLGGLLIFIGTIFFVQMYWKSIR